MQEYVKNLLEDIQRRPGVYLGKKSLDRLGHFLAGYMWCMHCNFENEDNYLSGFQEFIADYYNIHSAHNWSDIIQFFCSTDEEAFDKFYELLKYWKTFNQGTVSGNTGDG